MDCIEGFSEAEPSFKAETGSPTRGAFTIALVMLQERLGYLPGYERLLLLPTIEALNWDTANTFWRGSIMNEQGDAASTSAFAPSRAASRILLHMFVHWRELGISREARATLEVDLADILELSKIVSGPARVAFTKEEQIHIHNRLQDLGGIRSMSTEEQDVVLNLLHRPKVEL